MLFEVTVVKVAGSVHRSKGFELQGVFGEEFSQKMLARAELSLVVLNTDSPKGADGQTAENS